MSPVSTMTSLADAKFRRQVWPSLDVQEYHLILLGCLKAEPRDSRQRTELTVSKGEKSSLEFCGMLFMIVAGLLLREPLTSAFVHTTPTPIRPSTWLSGIDRKEWRTSSYRESGSFSKNLVSSLTNFVNSLSCDGDNKERVASLSPIALPPSSPQELLDRIRKDYVENNYLWTGDIDLASFHSQCEFTDPTLSFTGRDQFVANIQNLKSIVDVLVKGDCRSDLLDIQLNEAMFKRDGTWWGNWPFSCGSQKLMSLVGQNFGSTKQARPSFKLWFTTKNGKFPPVLLFYNWSRRLAPFQTRKFLADFGLRSSIPRRPTSFPVGAEPLPELTRESLFLSVSSAALRTSLLQCIVPRLRPHNRSRHYLDRNNLLLR